VKIEVVLDYIGCKREKASASLYLMRDEPREGLGFSYKMSLKERSVKLGLDHQHTNRNAIELGADPGIFGGK
jgi:hypothetical protein